VVPFIDRVGLVFLLCVVLGMLISKWGHSEEHPDAIDYESVDTSTSSGFNLASMVISLMLAGLYIVCW
jgi:SSS family solute:Na+ symporter